MNQTMPVVPLAVSSIVGAFVGYACSMHQVRNFPDPESRPEWWDWFFFSVIRDYGASLPGELKILGDYYSDNQTCPTATQSAAKILLSFGYTKDGVWYLKDDRFIQQWQRELPNDILEHMYQIALAINMIPE